MLDYSKSFIETQFPVSRLSKESYKERKSGSSQTLTGLGKWWGRKPLVMIRAALLGALLPVSDDPIQDRDIFLKLMSMDGEGLKKRWDKPISPEKAYDYATEAEKRAYFMISGSKTSYKHGVPTAIKRDIEYRAFREMSYDERLTYCTRPEYIDGPSSEAWREISKYLGENVSSFVDLTKELSKKRYGHRVLVGDCFCGGGSSVFEPARLGCDVFGSDLNPLAGLLTWADLNVIGSSEEIFHELNLFQEKVFDAVAADFDALRVETNDLDDIAKYYLYCHEVTCPECGYSVPTLPSLIISRKNNVIVQLHEGQQQNFEIEVISDVPDKTLATINSEATIQDGCLFCPHCKRRTSMSALRGGDASLNLRNWDKAEFEPRNDDVFRDRLYAIKYVTLRDKSRVTQFRKKPGPVTDATFGESYFIAPTKEDLSRENIVRNYVSEHFDEWQRVGYIPTSMIEPGEKTDEPMRTRGWQYWHHLFNPRHLLFCALLAKYVDQLAQTPEQTTIGLLLLHKALDINSKVSRWDSGNEQTHQTFYNQALNTLYNYGCKSTYCIFNAMVVQAPNIPLVNSRSVELSDAKDLDVQCDIWITDPPYADAVNYHELTEFFLAWDRVLLKKAFPNWYADSKRALAIQGKGKSFNESMVDVYRNLSDHMPENGMQIVMFTHQDTKVWAELAMILWSAGLQVSSAWCIATETDAAGLKQGNYVKGTVLMCLRKRMNNNMVFQDELYEMIRDEVQKQIEPMRDLDDKDDPDFNDGDYLLAAYVAALKVLTSYAEIEGIDVQYELTRAREDNGDSPVTQIINTAKKEAYDYLVPSGIDPFVWSELSVEERYYIKCFELELNGINKMSAYQEVARGFGVRDYTDLLGNVAANKVRVKTPEEFKNGMVTEVGFGSSIVRHVILAIYLSIKHENIREGQNYLRSRYVEGNQYWNLRFRMIEILSFLSKAAANSNMSHWSNAAEQAAILKAAIQNDSI